jgi:hypothetical protein
MRIAVASDRKLHAQKEELVPFIRARPPGQDLGVRPGAGRPTRLSGRAIRPATPTAGRPCGSGSGAVMAANRMEASAGVRHDSYSAQQGVERRHGCPRLGARVIGANRRSRPRVPCGAFIRGTTAGGSERWRSGQALQAVPGNPIRGMMTAVVGPTATRGWPWRRGGRGVLRALARRMGRRAAAVGCDHTPGSPTGEIANRLGSPLPGAAALGESGFVQGVRADGSPICPRDGGSASSGVREPRRLAGHPSVQCRLHRPGAVLAAERRSDPRTTLYPCDKSGGTIETLSFFKYFHGRGRAVEPRWGSLAR